MQNFFGYRRSPSLGNQGAKKRRDGEAEILESVVYHKQSGCLP